MTAGEAAKSKNAIPNFFADKRLISLISPKKKFGKICKLQSSAIENKGKFWGWNRRFPSNPRHPRVLQGFESADGEASPHSHSIVPGGLLVTS
jgi:hypothetical protein